MKRFQNFLLILCLLFASRLSSRNTIDSLKKIIKSKAADSLLIEANLNLAWEYMYYDTDSAMFFARQGLNIAQRNSLMLSMVNAYKTLGVCNIEKADYNKALSELSKGEAIGTQLLKTDPGNKKYKRAMMAIQANTGNVYYFLGKYDKSIDSYFLALKLAEEINFKKGMATCLSNIGISYKDLYNNDKALEYNKKALRISEETKDNALLVQSLNNIGSIYYSIPDYDSAYYYFQRCVTINKSDNNEPSLINSYVNLANVYDKWEEYDSAIVYYNRSLELSKKYNSTDGLINCNYMIAQMYMHKGDFEEAEKHFLECLTYAEEAGSLRFKMMANEQLAELYRRHNMFEKAFRHLAVGNQSRDSIYNAESNEKIAELEVKYETEKKEKEILLLREQSKLQKEQARNNKLIFLSITVILFLILVLGIISYRSAKHKQLAEKRGLQQKAEKKVLNAIIETEYKERKRFAEDLHDGLGVILSTLRLYINELTDKERSDEEKQQLLEESNKMLDDAIKNARNISNNIMPGSLKNNGLEISLRSYCDKINASGKIKIELTTHNLKKHYSDTLEITLFRVLTEMINNSLKHSGASKIHISFIEENKQIFVTYSDNGKGFDYAAVSESNEKGMGLNNIINRIDSIGGKCTMESSPGKGFFAKIVLDTEN